MLGTAPNDYVTARRAIAAELGPATIASLHRQNPLIDWLIVVSLPCLFVVLVVGLTRLGFGVAWLACFVLQGVVVQHMAYTVHDLFVHRRVGGRRLGYAIGVMFHFPLLSRRTWYALYHLDHHRHMGTGLDTEAYKQDLDRCWKRLFCLTAPGLLLAMGRKLRPDNAVAPEIGQGPLVMPTDPGLLRQLRIERLAVSAVALALIPALVLWWRPVLLGFLLPVSVVLPLLNGIRIMLEHAETDPENVYHCATFYRTGIITRPLFFWDAGDCHIVHHIYPGIPFYRMGRALQLIGPILTRHGARERRSFLDLLHGFFIRVEPHRTLWSS